MSVSVVDIRDAVCKCINEELQPKLVECGVDFIVSETAAFDKNSTRAMCVYKPLYDTCKENRPYIFVYGKARQLLLEESIADCRGGKEKKIQAIVSEYPITVEVVKKLCGKSEDENDKDAYPVEHTDVLSRLFEAIEDLLFCKRQIEVNGTKFYQDTVDPFSTGYDEFQFSSGMFIKAVTFTYKMRKCC